MLRSDVHKQADAMVAFDTATVLNGTETVLAAKPRLSIRYDGEDLGWNAPLQLAEVLRQSVIASVHTRRAPADGSAFVMERMYLAVGNPADSVSEDRVELYTRDDSEPSSNRIVTAVHFRCGSHRFATGLGHLRVVPKASYARLRGAGAGESNLDLPPREGAAVSVVPLEHGTVWGVRFNPRDPFFFDHPVDHVPGMLIFEAVRVAAAEMMPDSARLSIFDGWFRRFVELREDIRVELIWSSATEPLEFRVEGDGRLAAHGRLEFASVLS